MLRMSAILILITAFCGALFAQNVPRSDCPEISVTGPAGIIVPGGNATFIAEVRSKDSNFNPEFHWTVNNAEILSGQGTSTIKVNNGKGTIVATVTITNMPNGCPATASDMAPYCEPISAEKLTDLEAGRFLTESEVVRVVEDMLDHPTSQLYILAGKVGDEPSPYMKAKIILIADKLSEKGIERSRITFALVNADFEAMEFWRVPPGAENPTCKECY